eukprot:CAMPEP_0113702180 /NCGR_PEP_ID=MMETSP0038_2-20120614/25033_1 /TAXON_ID=2898 /ORGANISM="Cryptomonas paramecium" /LENGTH=143 /DNA_ID=CAMNT_0000626247 /DNA_START=429 /DNA_END=857 /DNA_ORIENTATION=- /assembly_acc=CAM_ASM_000170
MHCCSFDGCNGLSLPIPVLPMVNADPFNPQSPGSLWPTLAQTPTQNLALGYLGTDVVPYVAAYFVSGRACGFMYVDNATMLPPVGSSIILSGLPGVSLQVVRLSAVGAPSLAPGLSARPLNAYVCAADGQTLPHWAPAGSWVY